MVLGILLLFSTLMLFMNSGAEIAFFSLDFKELKNLRMKQYPSSDKILKLLQEPKQLLSSMLVGNMVFRMLIIILCNYLVTDEVFPGVSGILLFLLKLLAAIFYLVLFGELLPKAWASNNPIRFAFYSSFFVQLNSLFFSKTGNWFAAIADRMEKVLGRKDDVHSRLEQIDQAIGLNGEAGATEEEKNMLKGIAQFGNITVRRAMRSRLDVHGIEAGVGFDELKRLVAEQEYSRFPVYKESLDSIIGILHTKDLLPHIDESNDFDWSVLVRQAYFIHEQMLLEDLLKAFQNKRTHIAVVVDEFGGTDGIITMEDILEEIVGEIRDEYDDEEPVNIRIDENNYVFEGRLMINEACRIMNLPSKVFDPIRGESETVAGLVLELAGEIPKTQQVLVAQDFSFTVLEVLQNRIQKIKITITPPQA
ncbi:MAG: gliding motility-associated protein GldE [Bacteroidota bacterium]